MMKVQYFLKKHMIIWAVCVSFVLLLVSSLFAWDDKPVMGYDKICADSIVIVVSLLIIKVTGLWETAGFQVKGTGQGLLYGSPFLLIGIGSVFVSNTRTDFANLEFISMTNAVIFTINMILVGMNEEIWMRAFVLNGLLQKYENSQKGIWRAVIISAIIFGAIHIPNVFFMNPVTLLVQVVNAAAGGVLFGAVYIKSKNIWSGIIIHALVDWCSLFIGNCFENAASVISIEMSVPQAIGIMVAGAIPPVLIAWWILYKVDLSEKKYEGK